MHPQLTSLADAPASYCNPVAQPEFVPQDEVDATKGKSSLETGRRKLHPVSHQRLREVPNA
jgi:hypothetical protein